jgi:hypothetical protein
LGKKATNKTNDKMLFDGLWSAVSNQLAKLDDLPDLPTSIAAVTVDRSSLDAGRR